MAVYLGRNKVDFVGGQTVNVNGTDTSDATVTSDNLLKNVIAYGKNGQVIGSMPNNGNVSALFDGMNTKQISIPMGYTDGGTVGLTNDIDNEVSEQADFNYS